MIYTDRIHVVADTIHELHLWASKIGIKRHWFEGMRKGHPHYDIPKGKKAQIEDEILKGNISAVRPREILVRSKKMHFRHIR